MTTRPRTERFRAIGCDHEIVTTEPGVLVAAVEIARLYLADLDLAVSRFRADSEVSRLARRSDPGRVAARVSPMFADHLAAALRAARLTDGLLDPTVGAALRAAGYDADLDVVRARPGPAAFPGKAAVPGWRAIDLDLDQIRVEVPGGTLLDLGATAKAHAADTIAEILTQRLPGGFLVNLGGDIAVSGDRPRDGWQVGIEGADGKVRQVVASHGQAVATSSTRLRTWLVDGVERHHIIDPRTGVCARTPWAQVSCAAATALEANAASTAAVIIGEAAPRWLVQHGIPARLDHVDGRHLTTTGWPATITEVAS